RLPDRQLTRTLPRVQQRAVVKSVGEFSIRSPSRNATRKTTSGLASRLFAISDQVVGESACGMESARQRASTSQSIWRFLSSIALNRRRSASESLESTWLLIAGGNILRSFRL